MSKNDKQVADQILDLLLDALIQRQREREAKSILSKPVPAPAEEAPRVTLETKQERQPEPPPARQPAPPVTEEIEAPTSETAPLAKEPIASAPEPEPVTAIMEEAEPALEPDAEVTSPTPLPGVELGRMLGRLFLALIVLIALINIPYNRFGTSLARAMPDSAALIIRDGLLLKGSGEKVYVLEDNQRRWITTLDAFEEYGYRWDRVRVVEDTFLEKFEEGLPIHLLLKCQGSPHIYALENGKKRWIKDIPTFEAQGYVWEDVRFVACAHLRNMPDGLPIPEDAGPPPQP